MNKDQLILQTADKLSAEHGGKLVAISCRTLKPLAYGTSFVNVSRRAARIAKKSRSRFLVWRHSKNAITTTLN